MEAVVLIGVQAAGKSTFYRERFFATHVRISLDLLRARHRERCLLDVCLETRQPFCVDNTNPTATERRVYIDAARTVGFRVVGYYFRSTIADCARRNDERSGAARIPMAGLLGTYAKLELPSLEEGFDELFYVRPADAGFEVEEWKS